MQDDWMDEWLAAVAAGERTMSQRALSVVEKHGGLARAVAAARLKRVHLLQLTDDTGAELIAASFHPFRVLC